jgi:hypothetical protein
LPTIPLLLVSIANCGGVSPHSDSFLSIVGLGTAQWLYERPSKTKKKSEYETKKKKRYWYLEL